ncbi:MAG TPA: glycosyltransferase family 39 protein, partial [Polyangiaceae bacterium]|nr:glycosyltransferase family 39 protein [Polyangiaceae bacterium]
MNSPYTTLGWPPDGVAWAALAVAFALVPLLHFRGRLALGSALKVEFVLPALACSAALLSAGYVSFYLRGGPRIIDATSYYLQARAIAHGYFAFPVPVPLASFAGRFLLPSAPHSLSVIFPPGYATVLALGFLLRVPMLVGPILGALIVLATYALARELSGRTDVARVAAGLSLLCAALRYHTADTMSHGLCALLLCVGALTALRARRWDALLSGLALGWLVATRPVSGVVGITLALFLLERTARRWAWFGLGLVPGVALLLLYQRSATGSWFASTQLAYYALADGPPGCFRYGFGPGIGCLYEHGEYVRARLVHGYGIREALGVTLRRLAVHSIDIANAAPLALLCPVGAWFARADRRVMALFYACLGLMLAYSPFYFDGSYPGGGARLFADVLPIEHVLLAMAVVRLEWRTLALPLSLAGFAVHASFSHRALAEREGGRPMFEADVLRSAHVDHGLVFVDTDHGFNLGHDPARLDAHTRVVVARHRHGAHDWLLWNRLGRPPSFHYSYDAGASGASGALSPYLPSEDGVTALRFEAESEWPPLAVDQGWVQP